MLRTFKSVLFCLPVCFAWSIAEATPIIKEAQTMQAASPLEQALNKGFGALAAKKPADAKRFFEEAARLDPKSIFPWMGLADAARLADDKPGIDAALKKALELGPGRPEPIVAMARYKFTQNAFEEAETLLHQAVKLDPKSPIALVDLGDLYANVKNDPAKAMEFYRQAIQVGPDHAGAHYALGIMQAKQRDSLGAIASLERARDLGGGKNPLPSLALGQVYAQTKKWKESREAFTQAIAIEPSLVAAYVGRAGTFVASGNAKSAIADLKKAEELAPKNPEAPFRLGVLYQEQKAHKEAYAAYERALAIEPRAVLALNNLAWLAATRGERLAEATAWIEKARELAPKEPIIIDTQGWVLRARGELDKALAVLNEGMAVRPTVDLHYHLGVVQQEKGMLAEARDNLRKALQMQPDFADAKDARARLQQLDAPPARK
jgi:tetratricopeptide (TPR) repeat protein